MVSFTIVFGSLNRLKPSILNADAFFQGYIHNRMNDYSSPPTRESLERLIAKLDRAEYATTFPSGMGAIYATLAMLQPQDHLICSHDVYDGTHRYE